MESYVNNYKKLLIDWLDLHMTGFQMSWSRYCLVLVLWLIKLINFEIVTFNHLTLLGNNPYTN